MARSRLPFPAAAMAYRQMGEFVRGAKPPGRPAQEELMEPNCGSGQA
jgi:hypothetical protein